MKATMVVKPLVFAIAAAMATGVWADRDRDRDRDRSPYNTWAAGAHATVDNEQTLDSNYVDNQATENTADANNSANGSAGNLGVNVAAGNVNQQANEAALATADENFIFGHAYSSVNVYQGNYGNNVDNFSTQNNASITNMANGSSGNIGINVTAGNFNQQKNALAAAVSGGRHVSAYAGATQDISGADVNNEANIKAKYEKVVLGVGLAGGYAGGGGGVIHDEEPYKIEEGKRGKDDTIKSKPDKDTFGFVEAGGILLGGVAAGWVPVGATVQQAVVNNATLTNSLNGSSGNIGANVSAGSHNQQINSLSIAAGCNACPK
ncbi:heme utilization protein [Zestomonas carbonaria]|uniref:Heme utilization protein n=1 Tax=Zestomonas carbonaria TaxID=2762745 RepID=A0A7U7ESK5_9GAMM|nr:heme utilization protein [Pseudomonas carbonaria]CAD5110389.1 hypothetical protein PSEWESI4_04712 [Pseudomonas carbonaria]